MDESFRPASVVSWPSSFHSRAPHLPADPPSPYLETGLEVTPPPPQSEYQPAGGFLPKQRPPLLRAPFTLPGPKIDRLPCFTPKTLFFSEFVVLSAMQGVDEAYAPGFYGWISRLIPPRPCAFCVFRSFSPKTTMFRIAFCPAVLVFLRLRPLLVGTPSNSLVS